MRLSIASIVLLVIGGQAMPTVEADNIQDASVVAELVDAFENAPEAPAERVTNLQKRYANHNIRDCAAARIGGKYVWGGGNINGPTGGGFDCSGLTSYCVYQGTTVKLPRTSKTQYTFGSGAQRIPYNNRSVGNLVFYGCGTKGGIHHVGVVDYDTNFYISAYDTKHGIIRAPIIAKDLCKDHVLELGTK